MHLTGKVLSKRVSDGTLGSWWLQNALETATNDTLNQQIGTALIPAFKEHDYIKCLFFSSSTEENFAFD